MSRKIENNLIRLRELKLLIEPLETEQKELKSLVIDSWFIENVEYRTKNGILLADYKPVELTQFQATEFKKDHPKMYVEYSSKKTTYRFMLK